MSLPSSRTFMRSGGNPWLPSHLGADNYEFFPDFSVNPVNGILHAEARRRSVALFIDNPLSAWLKSNGPRYHLAAPAVETKPMQSSSTAQIPAKSQLPSSAFLSSPKRAAQVIDSKAKVKNRLHRCLLPDRHSMKKRQESWPNSMRNRLRFRLHRKKIPAATYTNSALAPPAPEPPQPNQPPRSSATRFFSTESDS
jgi:hypothetical protein